jgi:hypothetical protein
MRGRLSAIHVLSAFVLLSAIAWTAGGAAAQTLAAADTFNNNYPQNPPSPAQEDFNTNTGVVAAEIYKYGRDGECGGTNRNKYNEMYHATGVVVLEAQMQEYERAGRIIRCARCGAEAGSDKDRAICWLKPKLTIDFSAIPLPLRKRLEDGSCWPDPVPGSPTNIQCAPIDTHPNSVPAVQRTVPQNNGAPIVWNYYFINGMNAPPKGSNYGTYENGWNLIASHLVGPMQDHATPGEVHRMVPGVGYNNSGLNPLAIDGPASMLVTGCIMATADKLHIPQCMTDTARKTVDEAVARCNIARCGAMEFTDANKQKVTGNSAGGDLIESARQSIRNDWLSAVLSVLGIRTGVDYSKNSPLAGDIVNDMKAKISNSPGTTQYFVVVAHSQGNLFAEGLLAKLHDEHPDLLSRTGVLGLASPTNYGAVSYAKVSTGTRADDLILSISGKIAGVQITSVHALGNLAALQPQNVVLLEHFKIDPTTPFTKGLQNALTGHSNPALDGDNVPNLNAHLIENYLDDAHVTSRFPGAATVSGKIVEQLTALEQSLKGNAAYRSMK